MPSPPIMNYPSINTYYNNMLLNPKQMNNIMVKLLIFKLI